QIWESLGGKVQRSTTSPTSADPRRPSGPLVRFFEAATAPVCGGSPQSLKDVILEYKQWMALPRLEIKALRDIPAHMFETVAEAIWVWDELRDAAQKDVTQKASR